MINNYQQNPFYPQLLQTLQNMTPMQQSITPLPQQQQEVIKVNGRPGAEAYQMGPNSSVLMLDMTASMVWLAMTEHVNFLHEQVTRIINEYKATHDAIPAGMQAFYDMLHEQQIKKANKIKQKQEQYRK